MDSGCPYYPDEYSADEYDAMAVAHLRYLGGMIEGTMTPPPRPPPPEVSGPGKDEAGNFIGPYRAEGMEPTDTGLDGSGTGEEVENGSGEEPGRSPTDYTVPGHWCHDTAAKSTMVDCGYRDHTTGEFVGGWDCSHVEASTSWTCPQGTQCGPAVISDFDCASCTATAEGTCSSTLLGKKTSQLMFSEIYKGTP